MEKLTRPGHKWLLAALSLGVGVAVALSMVFADAADSASTTEGENDRIAFSNNATGIFDVYTMRPDGSGLKNLTNSPLVDNYHDHVSPDGSQIVFERAPAAGFAADIWVMNADGSGLRQITDEPANDRHPSWHPDGERIIFMSDRDGGDFDLYVVNAADGSGLVQLTNAPATEARPKYSSDGYKIAYTKKKDTGDFSGFSIHVMGADGRNDRQITPDAMEAAGNDWSPTGTGSHSTTTTAGLVLPPTFGW